MIHALKCSILFPQSIRYADMWDNWHIYIFLLENSFSVFKLWPVIVCKFNCSWIHWDHHGPDMPELNKWDCVIYFGDDTQSRSSMNTCWCYHSNLRYLKTLTANLRRFRCWSQYYFFVKHQMHVPLLKISQPVYELRWYFPTVKNITVSVLNWDDIRSKYLSIALPKEIKVNSKKWDSSNQY